MGFRSKTAGVGKGIVLALAALVAACAGHRHDSGAVIVDTRGMDMHAYHNDLEDCRAYGRSGWVVAPPAVLWPAQSWVAPWVPSPATVTLRSGPPGSVA